MLISGALEAGAYGDHPTRGVLFGLLTGLAYAGFILVLRHGGADLRRPAGPLFDATGWPPSPRSRPRWCSACADLAPAWPSHGWLLRARAQLPGARLDADLRLAPAAPRRADVDDR